MRMKGLLAVTLGLTLAVSVVGCSQQSSAANSGEAIEQSKKLQTAEEQAKFLIKQANAFISSEQFDEAITTAKYVLSKLDSDSQEAKGVIEQAQVKLKAMAEQKVDEMKNKISNFGN